MRLGKRERARFQTDRLERLAVGHRASLVVDHGGKYASACGKQVVTVPRHFNHTGWSETNSRRIARNSRKAA